MSDPINNILHDELLNENKQIHQNITYIQEKATTDDKKYTYLENKSASLKKTNYWGLVLFYVLLGAWFVYSFAIKRQITIVNGILLAVLVVFPFAAVPVELFLYDVLVKIYKIVFGKAID